MATAKRPNGYWTKERCKADAAKYNHRSDWVERGEKGAVNAARKKGWYEECTLRMSRYVQRKVKWSLETCKVDAQKYQTRAVWQRESASAYATALRKGWLDDCCSHMKRGKLPDGYWTKERVISDARNYDTVTAWRKSNGAPYNKARRENWLTEATAHMSTTNK